jgi:DNA-binding NarL/FixJ family response regulator
VASSAHNCVLVDPYPLFLEALERLLPTADVAVVGATSSPSEALALVRELHPDVIIVGVEARDEELGALDLIRELRSAAPATRVIAIGTGDSRHSAAPALSAGALVYLAKSAEPADILYAIRHSFRGSLYLATMTAPEAEIAENGAAHKLTRRELELLQLVSEGYTNAQMARMLFVTEQTIKFHLTNVYRKLGVGNRTEAGRWAQLHGLLDRDVPRREVQPAS